jgi:hypothetical protein
MQSRREFMRKVGVVLAALLVSGCQPQVTCYEAAILPSPTPAGGAGGWKKLRDQWAGPDCLAQDSARGPKMLEHWLIALCKRRAIAITFRPWLNWQVAPESTEAARVFAFGQARAA